MVSWMTRQLIPGSYIPYYYVARFMESIYCPTRCQYTIGTIQPLEFLVYEGRWFSGQSTGSLCMGLIPSDCILSLLMQFLVNFFNVIPEHNEHGYTRIRQYMLQQWNINDTDYPSRSCSLFMHMLCNNYPCNTSMLTALVLSGVVA